MIKKDYNKYTSFIDRFLFIIVAFIGDIVDASKLGKYIVRYNYTDSSGNAAHEMKRVVNVLDTQKPTITLLGEANLEIEAFSSYPDAGATAYDNYNGDITKKIIVTGWVNSSALGVEILKKIYVIYNESLRKIIVNCNNF